MMNMERLDRMVPAVLGTLVVAGVILAGTVTYDLDYLLLEPAAGISASGTNTICPPYVPAVGDTAQGLYNSISSYSSAPPICVLKLDRESDGHIRYPETIEGLAESHPCSLENEFNNITGTDDFDLVPGEGYRVVLADGADVMYTITGVEDPEAIVPLFKVGETTPEGASNTGMNDYCPPYNRVVDKASTLWDEIQCPLGSCSIRLCTEDGGQSCPADCTSCVVDTDCPSSQTCMESGFCTAMGEPCAVSCTGCVENGDCGETCLQGVCTVNGVACQDECTSCSGDSECGETCEELPRLCDGGANAGELCNAVISISRFARSSDSLTTYTGTLLDMPRDFDLESGESYRIQVRRHVDYVPGAFGDIDVYIESQRPAPCGFNDGGLLFLENRGRALIDVDWHGGDMSREEEPDGDHTNLVFLPDLGPDECGSGTGNLCVHACPISTAANTGCEVIADDCATCGCEIIDGLSGYCIGGEEFQELIPCEDDVTCTNAGGTHCALIGYLGPGEQMALKCDQVQCGSGGAGCNFSEGQNCCDQDFTDLALCNDPDPHVCVGGSNADAACYRASDCPGGECAERGIYPVRCTVVQPGYQFTVKRVSLDNGTTWIDEAEIAARGVSVALIAETKNCCRFRCDGGEHSGLPCTNHAFCGSGTCTVSPCEGVCEDAPGVPCHEIFDCPGNGRCGP